MQSSTIYENMDFIPFDNKIDIRSMHLLKFYSKMRVEYIPPSRIETDPNEQHQVGEEQNQTDNGNQQQKDWLISRLNEGLNESSSTQFIESWILDCGKLKIDIDRLARFGICKNASEVVEYLVEHKKANLVRLDVGGRSAIFYAPWPSLDDEMFKRLVSKMPEKSRVREINRQGGDHGQTLLHYAAKYGKSSTVELLLGMGANAQTKDGLGLTALDHIITSNRLSDNICHIMLILEFQKMVRLQPELRIGICEWGDLRIVRLDELEADLHYRQPVQALGNSAKPFDWFHLGQINGTVALVCFLLSPGCNVYRKQKESSDIAKSILRRYGRDKGYPAYAANAFASSFRESIRVPMNRNLPYRDPSYESNSRTALEPQKDLQVSIVFPCLVLIDRNSQHRRRQDIEKRRDEISKSRFLQSMLQPERTLDEAYFPSLSAEDLDYRNEHQVVTREYALTNENMATYGMPILMVNQLWIWRCGRGILTVYPSNSHPSMYFEKTIGSNMAVDHLKYPGIIIGLVIAHHISEFGRQNSGFPSALGIFESSITRILTAVDKYMDPNKPSRPDMKKEHDFMFRIADIREELAMIQEVLGQQFKIVSNLIDDFEQTNPEKHVFLAPSFNPSAHGPEILQHWEDWEKVKRSREEIQKYQKRAERIDRDADRVEKRIQDQLNLKRTHVSINDARAGLILSTAVIGFTVITIIFAPLAFMTSLFSLPLDILLQNQLQFDGGGRSYTTKYVATWFVVAEVVSLAVTILLVVLCLWLLGGTKIFTALQGNIPREPETRPESCPKKWQVDADETAKQTKIGKYSSGRETISLSTRVANLLHRRSHTSTSSEA